MTTIGMRICRFASGVGFGRAGELQRHQEIGRLAHAAHEAVLHRDHGGPAGARAQRDVIEAHFERAVDGHGAAEAHAAEHAELGAALEQQPDHLQEVLVPADGDAVLGHAAEARHHAVVQALVDFGDVADGAERHAFARTASTPEMSCGSGSIFRPSTPTTVWPSFIR